MADNFMDLDDIVEEDIIDEDILAQKIAFDTIFLACYNTVEGKRMIDTLQERFVNIPIYVKGSTIEETSYRQGMCDVVKMIEACVDDALSPMRSDV